MKRILKSKRGMAIESAIMFMLVTFMLGMLLTGLSMTMHLRTQLNDKTIENELILERIGDNFVHNFGDEEEFKTVEAFQAYTAGKGYTAEINNEKTTLTLKNKYTRVVLYIEKDGGKVVAWRYSE